MKLVAAALRTLAGAVIEAAHILASRSDRICCQDGTVIVEHEGSLWLHRLEWTTDQWAPLGMPGIRPGDGDETPKAPVTKRPPRR